ncbi:MAG: hypothetical protein ACRDD7_16645 [Peptostreptococcaceae bacterium]
MNNVDHTLTQDNEKDELLAAIESFLSKELNPLIDEIQKIENWDDDLEEL